MEIEIRKYKDKREVKKAELDFVYDTDNFVRDYELIRNYELYIKNVANDSKR